MASELTLSELRSAVFGQLRSPGDDVFRLEHLPVYQSASDGEDFARWRAGEREPTWERKNAVLDGIRARAAAGYLVRRVRVLSSELTAYERYACEWSYALNVEAGEDVRVLHRGEHPIPGLLGFDYWLINDQDMIRMVYRPDGTFLRAERVPELLDVARAERDRLWTAAAPFATWWAGHPELGRGLAA